jgi:hypothetical protein
MAEDGLKCRGLQTSFGEAKARHDYGKAIAETRSVMLKKGCDPCQGKVELMLLIQKLKTMRRSYSPDWCSEGLCFGMIEPHRQRLDRYIYSYESELEIHNEDCNQHEKIVSEFKQKNNLAELHRTNLEIGNIEHERILKLKQMEIQSRESMYSAKLQSDQKIKQMVLQSMEKAPHVHDLYKEGVVGHIKDIFTKK